MQRTALIALATAVVAAGIAATAAIVVTGDDEETVTLPTLSPGFTPEVTSEVETPSATPDGSPTGNPAASPRSGGATASAAQTPTASPPVEIRAAKNVDCDSEPRFCSGEGGVTLDAERHPSDHDIPKTTKRSDAPTIALTSELRGSNESEIEEGDQVSFIHVEVVVTNETKDRTFVFDKREIVLEVFRNGKLFDSFSTKGEGFEMTPGSKMTGQFDRPVNQPGRYTWRAKIWYYPKSG